MLTQTGLHLPEGISDLFSLINHQEGKTCEEIDVRWVSLPGSSPVPLKQAVSLQFPQRFSQLARRGHAYCRVSRADLPFVQFIAFGTTQAGEIRGFHADRDPRELIAECPELFGGKSTPDTVCGIMLQPAVTVSIHMPQDEQITRLVFFVRRFEPKGAWHLVRLGSLDLTTGKE